MKLLSPTFTIIAAVAVLSLPSHGALPEGRNIKTNPKELTSLERFFIRTFHPEIKLDEILAAEHVNIGNEGSDNGILDDYRGMLEFWNIELPTFLLQLVKMGDEILLPSFHHEYGFWFCYIGVCAGSMSIYDVRSPVLKNVTKTSLHGSVNGTQLRLDFAIPDIEIQCPEYTLEDSDLGQDPPSTTDTILWRGATLFIKNYTLGMSATIALGSNGLEVSNLDIEWDMDDLRVRYENGTHTFPDGRQEELGPVEDPLHEQLLDYWINKDLEAATEEYVAEWLNCFLSNGRSGGANCNKYLNEPLHRQSFAEIFHAFGLAASLNN